MTLEQVEKQIQTLLFRVKALETEDDRKSRIINTFMHDLNRMKNDFGSLKKKFKGDIQRLQSKIK